MVESQASQTQTNLSSPTEKEKDARRPPPGVFYGEELVPIVRGDGGPASTSANSPSQAASFVSTALVYAN
jgi:hypothetical protein